MNGAPANPISGVGPSSAHQRPHRRRSGSPGASGSSSGSASTSATERTGAATTGPTPGLISMSTPATTSGSTMSENRIAASTPCRRTGCRVISVTRSGSWQAASIAVPARRARYSGSDRPAWRMNHTGVRLTGRPRAARTRSESDGSGPANRLGGGSHDRRSSQTPRASPDRRPATRDRMLRRVGRGVLARRPTLRTWSPPAWPAPGTEARAPDGDEPPAAFRAALDALAGGPRPPGDRARAHPRPAAARALGARRRRPGRRAGRRRRRPRDRQRPVHRAVRPRRPRGLERHHPLRRLPVGRHGRGTGRRRHVLRGRVELADRRPDRGRRRPPQRRRHGHPHRLDPVRRPRRPRAHRRRRDARLVDGGGHRPRPSPAGLARGPRQRGRSAAARGATAGSLRPAGRARLSNIGSASRARARCARDRR